MIRTVLVVALALAPFAYLSHRYTSHVDAVTECVTKSHLPVKRAIAACHKD